MRRAVDDGNDEVTSDAERRAETLGSVLTNAARVLVVAFFMLMTLEEFGVNIGPLVALKLTQRHIQFSKIAQHFCFCVTNTRSKIFEFKIRVGFKFLFYFIVDSKVSSVNPFVN